MAWPTVTLPKDKGGLGVINLSVQNDALLLKNLHKFYNRADTPWASLIWTKHYTNRIPHATREVGSFWWKDMLRLSTIFRGFARCSLGDGTTVTFWEDLWSEQVLAVRFPSLFSFVRNKNISVNEVMNVEDLDSLFNLPLSQETYAELEELMDFCFSSPSMIKARMSGSINGETPSTPPADFTRWSSITYQCT